MTLQPFQYQIGDSVFGFNTDIPVSAVDIQTYNVNAQDFQVVRTDETRFGIDTLVPGPIVFKMSVLDNYILPNVAGLTSEEIPDSLFANKGLILPALAKSWKANDTRAQWGAIIPLLFCDSDGVIRRIYGRPGKFTYARKSRLNAWFDVQAEFRRADTYAYDDTETYIQLEKGNNPHWADLREGGDADPWIRILLVGPITNPVITLGDHQIKLNYTIPANDIVEISSYPWMRRIIDNNGVNLRTKLAGDTQYLDEIKLTAQSVVPMRWTDSSVATWTQLSHNKYTENVDFLDMFFLWFEYTAIHGRPMWGWNALCGGYVSAPWGTAAAIDNRNAFQTSNQYGQVRIATTAQGRSSFVIMSNTTMTNFVCIEVETNAIGSDYLRIRSGSSYSNLTTRSEYEVVSGINRLDTVGIWSDGITHTFQMILNDENVGTPWVDSGHVVDMTNNRRHGFILNSGNSTSSIGPGFDNVTCYDISVTEPTTGQCFVLWRDTYHVI